MVKPRVLVSENRLLAALSSLDRQRFEPYLERVPLTTGQVVLELGRIRHVFFPISGVISKIVRMRNCDGVEAGMVGNEGMLPLCLFLELDKTPFRAVVQNPGQAWRMESGAFKSLVKPGAPLHAILLRFAAAFMAQVSQSAACNQMHPLQQRYCRWLLMTHDRLGTNELFIKQEFAAQMLGVRRMSITPVARILQQAGLIQYSRGRITILNRRGVETASCECYRRVKLVYDDCLKT